MDRNLSPQQIYDLIQDYCFKHSMSQTEFAALSGVSQATLSKWRMGASKNPQPKTLGKVKKMLEGKNA